MKWVFVLTTAALAAACAGGSGSTPAAETASAPAVTEAPRAPEPAAVHEITIPSGTALRLDLGTALGSDTSKVEDLVRATVRQPVTVHGETVIPTGAELVGNVTGVERSGRVKGRARISYRFSKMTVNGETYEIRTSSIGHEAEATKKADATKIGIGAGAGAVLGGILGGGSGAAKGAAIGGAAGTGAVLATRGKEVRLAPGANVATTLTAPLTVRLKA
jgi:hypothetical protein